MTRLLSHQRAVFIVAALQWLFAGAAVAAQFPQLSGRVVDSAAILPAATKTALEAKLKALEDTSSIQLVVATIPSLSGGDIESYGNGLFRFWKLGDAKKNNGVLLLIAPNDRKMRIEVGYGLEGTLTDAISKVIIATAIAPRFKAGDFAGGAERGVDAIIETLSSDKSEWAQRAAAPQQDTLDDIMPLVIFLLFLFIVLYMSRNARGGGRGGGPTVFFPGASSSGSRDGGSPSSGSWSDGGGFSGGGGSSGGGGASGDW